MPGGLNSDFACLERDYVLDLMSLFPFPLIKQKTQHRGKNERERARGREKRIKEKLTRKAKQLKYFNLVFKSIPVSLLLRDMTVKENEFLYFQPTRIYVHIYTHPQHRHTNVQRRRRKIYTGKDVEVVSKE